MKKGLFFVFLIVFLALSITFTSAFWPFDFAKKIFGSKVSGQSVQGAYGTSPLAASCNDSDGGIFPYVNGNVNYVLNGVKREVVDICLNGGYGYGGEYLKEYYCNNSVLKSVNILCKDGCENGACINANLMRCADSDGGRNYTLKGNVTKGDVVKTDFCDGNVLREYYCDNRTNPLGIIKNISYNCTRFGYSGCENGACINTSLINCNDSDGGINIYVAGIADERVNWSRRYYNDACVTSRGSVCTGDSCTAVAEGYCSDKGVSNILMQCPTNRCENGACIRNETEEPRQQISTKNQKNMSKYSEREVFLISDKNWKDVLPLVPVTTWTGNENNCTRGYGTAENVCVYPTLIWHEENYSDKIIQLDSKKIIDENYLWAAIYFIKNPIYEQKINAKSFNISFELTLEFFNRMQSEEAQKVGEDYLLFEIRVKSQKFRDIKALEDFEKKVRTKLKLNDNNMYNYDFYSQNTINSNVKIFRLRTNFESLNFGSFLISGTNKIALEEVDEDYTIEDVRIFLGDKHILEADGRWKSIWISSDKDSECSFDWTDLCITELNISDKNIKPKENFSYSFKIKNIKDSIADLSENGLADLEIESASPINPLIDIISFPYFEKKILTKGDTIEIFFNAINTLSENPSFDVDSIIYFMQQYQNGQEKITVVGQTPQELDNLLVTPPEAGAGISHEMVKRISPRDYLSYWQNISEIVYVEDNYELALLAASYASLINAPLIIKGTSLDNDAVFSGKEIVCVGNVGSERNCKENYNLEQLHNKYAEMTKTKKFIFINPDDLDSGTLDSLKPRHSNEENIKLYQRESLVSPLLAAGKQELILPVRGKDYKSIDQQMKSELKKFYSFPEAHFCNIGEPCSNGFAFVDTNVFFVNKELSLNLLPAASTKNFDVSVSFVDIYSKQYLAGEESNVSTIVANIGKENAADVSVKLYSANRSYYDDNLHKMVDEFELIDSKKVDILEKGDFAEIIFKWTPKKIGENKLLVRAEYATDENPLNNEQGAYLTVIASGADVTGWFNKGNTNFIKGKESRITAYIGNIGTKVAENVVAKLFLVKKSTSTSESEPIISLIDSVSLGSISNGEGFKKIEFKWTPEEAGNQELRLIIESPSDVNPKNNQANYYAYVQDNKPILDAYVVNDFLLVGEDNNLKLIIKNIGAETAKNVRFSLYNVPLNEENSEKIADGNIGDLKSSEEKEVTIKFKPSEKGRLNLKFVAESDNAEKYERTYYLRIIEDKPELYPNLQLETYTGILNKEKKISLNVYNVGAKKAKDVIAKLYEFSRKTMDKHLVVEDNLILKSSLEMRDIEVGESKTGNLSYVPDSIGQKNLKVSLEFLDEDGVRKENAFTYTDLNIFERDGPEVGISFWNGKIINKDTAINIYVDLFNQGTLDAENFTVHFYDNSVLKNSFLIDKLEAGNSKQFSFSWVPETYGTHELKAIAEINDLDASNNEFSYNADVYETKDVFFNVKNGHGEFVKVAILLFSHGEFDILKNIEDKYLRDGFGMVSVPPGKINAGISYESKSGIFYSMFVNSSLNESANFISEYYNGFADSSIELYGIYANKADWVYDGVSVGLIPAEYDPDMKIYFCANWDFVQGKCAVSWTEAETKIINFYSTIKIITAEGKNVEAFGIGKPVIGQRKMTGKGIQFVQKDKSRARGILRLFQGDYENSEILYGKFFYTYDLVIPGFFYDCTDEKDNVEIQVFKEDKLVSWTKANCVKLNDAIWKFNPSVTQGFIPNIYIEIPINEDLADFSGKLKLKFSSKLALFLNQSNEQEQIKIIKYIKYYVWNNNDRANTIAGDIIFSCNTTENCRISDMGKTEVAQYISNGTSEFIFKNLNLSLNYSLFIDLKENWGFKCYLNDVLFDCSSATYSRKNIDIPRELLKENLTLKIALPEELGEEYFYKIDAYIVPQLDGYLSIFASPFDIPVSEDMWYYDIWIGFIKRALDPTQYASVYEGRLPNMANGRIFGITSSDVSSYIARDLFYDTIGNNKNVKFMASSFDYEIKHANNWKDAFNLAGYNAEASTSPDECHSFNPDEWKNQSIISYMDHGSSNWAGISSMEIPLLSNSLVFNDACSTCSRYDADSFCTTAIKQGAVAHYGAVSVAFTDNKIYYNNLNGIYHNNLDLGNSFKNGFVYNKYYYPTALLGDPTLKPYTPYLLGEELNWSY